MSMLLRPPTSDASRAAIRPQRGVALFVGLVFLVMLSLLALVVMKGTLLEMQMTTATARHEQAFEASEAMRPIPEAVLADHIFNRGWPVAWGGAVPNALFDLNSTYANRLQWVTLMNPNTTTGKGLRTLCGGTALVSFYLPVGPCVGQTDAYNYTPSLWNNTVLMDVCNDGTTSCTSDKKISGAIAVIRDGVTLNKGSGAAMSQGYASVGVGTAKGGSALLLQVRSNATVPGNGNAVTIAQYKINLDH
jgi:Tfp pilus assembly protein PilX